MKPLPALAALLIATIPSSANSADGGGLSSVLGIGIQSCGVFVEAVNRTSRFAEDDRHGMMSWTQGYLSHYNSIVPGVYDISRRLGPAALQQWLYNYYRRNPLEIFDAAVEQLIIELYPGRLTARPQ